VRFRAQFESCVLSSVLLGSV